VPLQEHHSSLGKCIGQIVATQRIDQQVRKILKSCTA
jgi:hypothetical protein